MNLRFEGRWRWAIAVAVFVGVAVGQFLPDGRHLLVRATAVGAVTATCLAATLAVRVRLGE